MNRSTLRRAPSTGAASGGSAFADNVAALLERVEYRRCEKGEDLEAIYRLRYKAYRNHGTVPPTAERVTTDRFDDAPNCYMFGVWIDNELVSTVRLHHLTAEQPYSSVMDIFGDLISPRLERGETFINPTMFAADPYYATIYRALPYVTLRLAVVANSYFDTTSCICVIRDDHTAFYKRVFGSVQVGEPRPHPSFSVNVMLYDSPCAINMQPTLERFPFFRSTALERRLLFGQSAKGEVGSLTILPTARYMKTAA
ncbi:N-acyl amino acid synthase FeeM domain-containing protein [Aquibium carbonis]|uniref:N-acyl amino acid synthase FeeM domain-containing protein n=1 Tax=Aquibium carbonis TaxID=2495581 RepID=UPI001FDF9F48|nr:hypothetical protein [Aquibium carbonis]